MRTNAAALWNSHLHEYLTGTLGFRQSPTDPCLYLLGDEQAARRAAGPIAESDAKIDDAKMARCDKIVETFPDKEKGPFIALLAYVDDCCITGGFGF